MEVVGNETEGDEDEEDVRPGSKEEIFVGFYPPGLVFRDAEEGNDSVLVRRSAPVTVRTEAVL